MTVHLFAQIWIGGLLIGAAGFVGWVFFCVITHPDSRAVMWRVSLIAILSFTTLWAITEVSRP